MTKQHKKKLTLTISPNLYNLYKDKYNLSKILDEILTDFLIVGAYDNTIYDDTVVTMKTDGGKIYKIDSTSYRQFINHLKDITERRMG